VYHHPEISRALTAEHIADFLRAAEVARRGRTGAEPAQPRRRRRVRWPHAARRVPAPQAGSGAAGGRSSTGNRNGVSVYPAPLAPTDAPSRQSMTDHDDDQSRVAAMSQARC
jgi:hypothetical protein